MCCIDRMKPPPAVDKTARRPVHVRTIHAAYDAPTPDRDGLVALKEVRRDRPGFITTPRRIAPMTSAVAVNLALRLPAKSLTDREISLFLAGLGIEAPKSFDPIDRPFSPEVSMLPPTHLGGRQFLNLVCVHPCAYRLVAGVVDAALGGRNLFDFQAQASPREIDLLMRSCG